MYPWHSPELAAVESLAETFETPISRAINIYFNHLNEAVLHNTTYGANDNCQFSFSSASSEMTHLAGLLSVGFDSSTDWENHPSSLVKRMDLNAIGESSRDIRTAFTQLLSMGF